MSSNADPTKPDVPAGNVHPTPVSRTLLMIFCAVFSLGMIAVAIVVTLAWQHSNSNSHNLRNFVTNSDRARAGRDKQIGDLTHKLKVTSDRLDFVQTHQTQVLCDAIVKSVRTAKAKGTPQDPGTVPFLKSFGCKVPADLAS